MYIRSTTQKNSKTGRIYINYRLVESYRNRSGKVRQQTLLNLGTSFDFPKDQWKMLADRIEEIRNGQESIFQCDREIEREAQRIAKLVLKKYATTLNDSNQCTTDETDATDFQTVDINSIQHQDVRKIGCEHVAVHAARQLKLEEILKGAGFNDKQSKLALGSIIGRLIQPGSELSTHRYLSEHSALDELISTDFTKLSLKNLYLVSDLLLKHKTLIENKIYQREKDLFNIEETVTLYDITNTYFEGQGSKNNKAARGRSKEKRSDRSLVALGMVLDSSGFPRRSDIFPGNISEPKTLKSMLLSLEASKNATVVMDAGFATEENISWLQEQGYQYIVVSRKKHSDISCSEGLKEYKAQSGTEAGFKFIKDDTFQVDSVFLKTPARINALMVVMTLCLMVYGVTEYELRQSLQKHGETVTSQTRKQTNKPSLKWVYFGTVIQSV